MQNTFVRSAGVKAAEAIRERIIGGGYPQGQKLTEEECAASLDVSRIVIRDAFALLIGEGLLVKQVNKGVTVARFGPDDIRDIYDLRLSLEQLCARLCFQNGTVPLAAMERCCLNLNRYALSGQGAQDGAGGSGLPRRVCRRRWQRARRRRMAQPGGADIDDPLPRYQRVR